MSDNKSKKSSKKSAKKEINQYEYQPSGNNFSTRQYLEANVTTVIQEAMLECVRNQPPNPLQFIGNYILKRANGQ